MERDLLDFFRESVTRAIEDGIPFEQFQKQITPRLQERGWWGEKQLADPKTGKITKVQLGSPSRLDLIYQSNMRSARSAGQWERIQRTKELRPFLLYQLGPSERHRPKHVAWDGTILPVDDPFWDSHMPPNGWRCKCHVIQLSERQADRKGGVTERPSRATEEFVNPRTGEKTRVPIGIDPGWGFNPGIERFNPLKREAA